MPRKLAARKPIVKSEMQMLHDDLTFLRAQVRVTEAENAGQKENLFRLRLDLHAAKQAVSKADSERDKARNELTAVKAQRDQAISMQMTLTQESTRTRAEIDYLRHTLFRLTHGGVLPATMDIVR